MSQLYLVRHAKAGERRLWTGDDTLRPLSKKGWKQSELLAQRLAKLSPGLLCSSPYVRCVQTLEPLAKRLGVTIETDQRLGDGESVEPVFELLAEAPDHSVLSSHGDMIPATLMALEDLGAKLRTPPDWRKASVWVLDRNKNGRIVRATVWPPPIV